MAFTKAKREKVKARIGLTGPTNSGKSVSGLYLAYGIVWMNIYIRTGQEPTEQEVWSKIAGIDSERGRLKMYANRTDLPFPIGEFMYAPISPPYSTEKYIALVKQAEEIVGEDGVIFIDSISHAWKAKGGVLSKKNEKDKKGGNSYTNWNDATEEQDEFIDVLLSTNCHTIVTMRSKMDYVLETTTNAQGREVTAPKQVGLAPVQRDDVEYEFDVTLMIDKKHRPSIIKDTTFLRTMAVENMLDVITPELGKQLIQFLEEGIDPAVFKEERRLGLIEDIKEMAKKDKGLKSYYKNLMPDTLTKDLTIEQAEHVLQEFREF